MTPAQKPPCEPVTGESPVATSDQTQVYVVRYQPQQSWCREGLAIAEVRNGKTLLSDTYWEVGGDQHLLSDAEAQTAEVIFTFDQYDELPRHAHGTRERWMRYAPSDRQTITSQHGLVKRYFIRKGATEDLATQIENAQERLREAKEAVTSAERRCEWARRDLEELLARADMAERPSPHTAPNPPGDVS